MAFSETFKAFHNTVASWERSVGHLLNSVCWVLLCVFHFRRLSPWSIWSCWTLSFKVSETFVIIRICSFKKSQILSDVPFFSENFFQGTVCVSLGMMWCWVHSGHFCLLFAWVFCSVSHWWLCKVGCFIFTVDEQQPSWNSLKDAAVDNGQTVCTALVNICSALIIVWRHQPAKLHNS